MSTAARLLALAIAVAALVAGGYRWGAGATADRLQAESNRAAIKAQERFDAELLRGQDATTSLIAERQVFAASYTHLQEKFHDLSARIPILARSSRVVPACVPLAAQADDRAGVGPRVVEAQVLPGHAPALSAGALWMWNSALTGTDQPAGACGAADTSEQACAPEAGVNLDDAWRNHEINAKLCAQDRLNHQRLIDYLTNNTVPTTGQQARENQP
jgi:hypothetical protein